jgi:lysozyme family protein
MSNFDTAINRVLGIEGNYVNDPNDPGGETKFGISKRSYPNLDIKDLTGEQAVALYHRDFWEVLKLDSFPLAVSAQVLDFAVNSGNATAIHAAQRAAGVADDGRVGPVTLAALQAMETHDFVMCFLAERLQYLSGLNAWKDYGKGWARRIAAQLRNGAHDA